MLNILLAFFAVVQIATIGFFALPDTPDTKDDGLGAVKALQTAQGGTGTTTIPTTGQVLVGQSNGTYAPQATSTLGIIGGSGTNYLTNSGANTFLNTGTNLQAPKFEATSTTASVFTYASTTAVSASRFWGPLTGSVTGTASLATALAANGSNCSAGNSPLGVDASGAVESCFDVWTEAENTAAAYLNAAGVNSYIHGSTTIPKTYTANTFTGVQTIGNASTTYLSVSDSSFLGTVKTGTWNGTAIGDAYLTKSGDWTGTFDGQQGTYYLDFTNLTVSNGEVTPNMVWATGQTDEYCLTYEATGSTWEYQLCGTGGGSISGWATTTSSVSGQLNLYPTNTSDILNVGGSATTTSEFWVDPNTVTAQLNGSNGTSSVVIGSANNEWVLGTSNSDKSFRIASSTGLLDGATAVLTLSKAGVLTVANASTTYTTATTFFGALTGTASLATALAANGANCTVTGQVPLGVDASGAAESCTSVVLGSTTTLPLLTTLAGVTSIGTDAATTTAQGNWTADAFGVVAKFFVDASQMWVSVSATFNEALIAIKSLQIPFGATPTVDVAGEIAVRTSPANALVVATSTASTSPAVIPLAPPVRFTQFSSSTGTTTAGFPTLDYNERILSGICWGEEAFNIRVGDGTNWSNTVAVTTSTTTVTFSSETLFNAGGEKIIFQTGPTTTTGKAMYCSFRRAYELL
jgi:hypothetical protein